MKQIIISIKPKWVAKILNGEKTLEIRKSAPKEWVDYLNGKTDKKPEPVIVNIYCTKSDYIGYLPKRYVGKVIAKFTLSEIVPIVAQRAGNDGFMGYGYCKKDHFKWYHEIKEQVCLDEYSLTEYLNNGNLDVSFRTNKKPKNGYAWHISDLEIFDEPKELSEFSVTKWYKSCDKCPRYEDSSVWHCSTCIVKMPLKRAPESWCYLEEKE